MAVCDKNCFACIYDDCICDELDYEEVKESDKRDLKVAGKRKYTKREKPMTHEEKLARRREYYAENRERIRAREREREKKNKEKVQATRKKYYESHKEQINEYMRGYRERNRERVREYNRERYHKKREQQRSETP